MTRQPELKEAFWAVVDHEPAEQARQLAALAAADPDLHQQLQALLAADARGDSLQHIFGAAAPDRPDRPTRIGQYDIVGVLGEGGMGEVYRAHDSRLRRDVAIKVLPPSVANDRERLARFEREAQVLASLNHPHVAQVYGLEESGSTPALVMELVEGPTLGQQIAGYPDAPLTLTTMLTLARQIADGLDAAHEKGIIHRDLKPGNIALTHDGVVKILDFGIAKSASHAGLSVTGDPATQTGAVLGTPAYMSPEQARGLAIDKRTDIWAFGCVLYELLTGQRPFRGATASDAIVAVLERDPDFSILPADTPATVRSLIRHCLEKDPKRRLRDIADARLALDDVLNQPADERGRAVIALNDPGRGRSTVRERVLWMTAGLAVAAVVAMVVVWLLAGVLPSGETRTVISSIVPAQGMQFNREDNLEARYSELRFAISPNGRQLALVAADDSGRSQLWLRDLDSFAFRPLPDTDDASNPFWSPDSQFIGFIAAGKLKKIRASGGTSMTVSEKGFRTSAWSSDDVILFTPGASSALYRVPASGGEPAPVTRLDKASGEVQHSYPSFLPDGRHFFYFSIGKTGAANASRGMYLGSLDGSESALLLPGATQARYAQGHVLFRRSGTLMAQPFDTKRLELRGAPVPLVEQVKMAGTGATGVTGGFSVSDNGVLAYQTGSSITSHLVWFDRTGKTLAPLGAAAKDFGDVALSPDGASLAVSAVNPALSTRDLWLYDVATSRGTRFTFDPADEFAPVWSPDGTRVLFSSVRQGAVDLYVKNVNGLSDPKRLDVDNLGLGRFAADWSRDDRFLMYIGGGKAIAGSDLWIAPLASPEKARPLLDSTFVETHGRFAPGGAWFAYASSESERLEVYVDRFPDRGAKRMISSNGGGWPRWVNNGTEIVYLSADNQLMVAAVHATRDHLDIAPFRPLFVLRPRPPARLDAYPYDVTPDGRRIVVNTPVEEPTATPITLMVNWIRLLKNE